MARPLVMLIDIALIENVIRRAAVEVAIDNGSTIISPLWLRECDRERERLEKLKVSAERTPPGTIRIRRPVKMAG